MKKIFLILLVCFTSCQSDVENFKIKGVITSEENGYPIEEVGITFICWYYGNSPDQSYSGQETKKVFSNEHGEYEIIFDKGSFVEIKIDHNGFSSIHETTYINDKSNSLNFKMKPE